MEFIIILAMLLYYTTINGYRNPQSNPERSLGGFMSSTPVANSDFSNLFDELSIMTIKSGRSEYRAIMLYNESDSAYRNIFIKMEKSEDCLCDYELSVGEMIHINKYGQKSMENVSSINHRPFNAEFIKMDSDSVLQVGDLEPGQEIGLWICRTVDKAKAKEQLENVCVPDMNDPSGRRYIGVDKIKEESVSLIIEWE